LKHYELDSQFQDWGESSYYSVSLQATCRLSELLGHLYVLIPVLDDEKHYWVGESEVEKLLRHGEGWLAAHPEKNLIAPLPEISTPPDTRRISATCGHR